MKVITFKEEKKKKIESSHPAHVFSCQTMKNNQKKSQQSVEITFPLIYVFCPSIFFLFCKTLTSAAMWPVAWGGNTLNHFKGSLTLLDTRHLLAEGRQLAGSLVLVNIYRINILHKGDTGNTVLTNYAFDRISFFCS